jgi:hypothetical protein
VEILLYAALLSLLVSRDLLDLVADRRLDAILGCRPDGVLVVVVDGVVAPSRSDGREQCVEDSLPIE